MAVRILFVCHGNICRSPMAEYVLKDMVAKAGASDMFHIESAATSSEELGNPMHYGTERVLRKHGIPFDDHLARKLRRSDGGAWDLIVVMDSANVRNARNLLGRDMSAQLYKLMDFCGTSADVADPWYTGDFETTYDDIVAGCRGLLAFLGFDAGNGAS